MHTKTKELQVDCGVDAHLEQFYSLSLFIVWFILVVFVC